MKGGEGGGEKGVKAEFLEHQRGRRSVRSSWQEGGQKGRREKVGADVCLFFSP